ncbi:MAG TPA: hypothetical protein VN345_14820 [Blastocatellia bacterium]|nr:hypothetical protein [Blastocatellia bacterium]
MRRCEADCYRMAAQLRSRIAELFGGEPAETLILCPGILIGLQALFSNLDVKRVALSDEEYYGQIHFPHLATEAFAIDELIGRVRDWKPDAVVLSLVTWRGRVIPLAEIFRELRAELKEETPLLIADYSHGGAVGFPDMAGLNADIVCGDPLKWIAKPDEETRLAFLRIREGALLEKALRVFRPFFLATAEQQEQLLARWLDPREIQDAVEGLSRLDRGTLASRHAQNLSLARQLGFELGVSEHVQSSILWLGEGRPLPEWLARSGLVWKAPGGGVRILCRAEIEAGSKLPRAHAPRLSGIHGPRPLGW